MTEPRYTETELQAAKAERAEIGVKITWGR